MYVPQKNSWEPHATAHAGASNVQISSRYFKQGTNLMQHGFGL